MKYKLVAIDLDGTLVDREGRVAEEDKVAITRLVKNFVQVVLCTGRILKTADPFIKELNLTGPHVTFDGALICTSAGLATVYELPLTPEVIKEAVDYCRAEDIYLELYSRETFFAERKNWSDDVHRNFFGVDPTLVNFDDIWDKESFLKAEMVVGSPDDALKAKGFADHFSNKLNFSIAHTPAYPEMEFLNILHPGASKGAALKHLADRLGVYRTEIIAIGDGMNDLSLLNEAGHAVAMGDAPDEVKQICEYITSEVEHQGVTQAINHYFPL